MTEVRNKVELLTELFQVVEGCCLHNPVWRPSDVVEIIRWYGDLESCSESHSIVIARLVGGDYGLFEQGEDYTGHGCQCNSATFRGHRLSELVGALDDWDLRKLIEQDDTPTP